MAKNVKGIVVEKLRPLKADPYLKNYLSQIEWRQAYARQIEQKLTGEKQSLTDFASGHEFYGLHKRGNEWIFREWAPNASAIYLIGTFNNWSESETFALKRIDKNGSWEIILPEDAIHHADLYKLKIYWEGGSGERIPAYTRRSVQDEKTLAFSAQVWTPPTPYEWQNPSFRVSGDAPLIYETHVGMAQEEPKVGTFNEFKEKTLPRIRAAGYNTIQLMAILEHPYYGSFGYHVSNFFAVSSRFGTPEEFKSLVDTAHSMGIAVVIDLVHSHAAKNEVEGLSRFDGTTTQYFHAGEKGNHAAWDSRCFDYGKPQVLHFLLSNCKFWLDEYKVDGFRFDGITSMIYFHHGFIPAFDNYGKYFDSSVDEDALAYLSLANRLIHDVRPDAITIAEDVSGMPGLAAPAHNGGIGFNMRLAMGIPDCWSKLLEEVRDEDWDIHYLWHEMNNRRADEQTVSYVESHDQAIVGDKTAIFKLIDAKMYEHMGVADQDLVVERGIALHKIIRLLTASTAGAGYLNFMGNEFGHPEWMDFPREGNNWSYHYARRLWSLRDDPNLKYKALADFDAEMLKLLKEFHVMANPVTRPIVVRKDDKVIIFERAGLFFFFNFHPNKSYEHYVLPVPPGEYNIVLDSDSKKFGGHARLDADQTFYSISSIEKNERKDTISVYLPSRSSFILRNNKI